ncbi:hypothetical protein DSUL_60255 [Desulfovibrionales bacterium]
MTSPAIIAFPYLGILSISDSLHALIRILRYFLSNKLSLKLLNVFEEAFGFIDTIRIGNAKNV